MSTLSTRGIAGLSMVCKTIRAGFDSLPRLHYHPEWQPEYVMRDGKRLGPFMWSTRWTRIDEQARLIFGDDLGESLRKKYGIWKRSDHINLARRIIEEQQAEISRWKSEAIEARKKISCLKRQR